MSPTIFRELGYRFFFFSRKESRSHVHVYCSDGEAKFWLDPEVEGQSPGHLYWPDLDVDLGIETIEHSERFPLQAK